MKRLQLMQVLKSWAAYTLVSGVTVDAALLLADRGGIAVPSSWYVNAPLGAVVLVGLPTTFALASRIVSQVDPKPGRVVAFNEGGPSPLSSWRPFTANGRTGRILASSMPAIFGDQLPLDQPPIYHPAVWVVPIEGVDIRVREAELWAFLDVAWRREKHQFSRRYWTKRKRPPVYRPRYEAFMRLLVDAGLVEGRHEQGGASGRLLAFPREAIRFLKYESAYKVA